MLVSARHHSRTREMLVARAALRTAHGSPSARALRRARECRARIAFSASASSSADDAASAGSATFVATSLASTERIARALARDARVGDVVCLHGDVGAGKSVLSRAFVRAVARDPTMEVPSPTFLLQQVYDDHDASFGPAVHHFDLYRCGSVAETVKLDLPGSFATAASLIEWAERLEDTAPADRLDVYLRICGERDAARRETGAVVVAGDDEDEDDEDEDDDVDPAFLDAQPRVVRLEGKGEAWRDRVDALAKALAG